MGDPIGSIYAAAPHHTKYLVPFLQQQLCQVRSILSGDSGDKCSFHYAPQVSFSSGRCEYRINLRSGYIPAESIIKLLLPAPPHSIPCLWIAEQPLYRVCDCCHITECNQQPVLLISNNFSADRRIRCNHRLTICPSF